MNRTEAPIIWVMHCKSAALAAWLLALLAMLATSGSPSEAATTNQRMKVTKLDGQATIARAAGDSATLASDGLRVKNGNLEPGDLLRTYGGSRAEVELKADGSVLHLDPHTSVIVTFPASAADRQIQCKEGAVEARFPPGSPLKTVIVNVPFNVWHPHPTAGQKPAAGRVRVTIGKRPSK